MCNFSVCICQVGVNPVYTAFQDNRDHLVTGMGRYLKLLHLSADWEDKADVKNMHSALQAQEAEQGTWEKWTCMFLPWPCEEI